MDHKLADTMHKRICFNLLTENIYTAQRLQDDDHNEINPPKTNDFPSMLSNCLNKKPQNRFNKIS